MNVRATIVKTGILAGNPVRKIRGMVSEGLAKGIEIFHRRRQRDKFTTKGGRRYHFERRSDRYERRKQREKGHRDPNVWSGVGRREILRRVDVKTYKGRAAAEGRWSARFLNFSGQKARGNKGKQPNHRREIEATVKRDTDEMAKVAERVIARAIDSDNETQTIRI